MAAADRIEAAGFAKDLSLTHSECTINSRQQASRPNGSAAALAGLRSQDHAGKGARSPADLVAPGTCCSCCSSRMLADQARVLVDHDDEAETLCERADRRTIRQARAERVKCTKETGGAHRAHQGLGGARGQGATWQGSKM